MASSDGCCSGAGTTFRVVREASFHCRCGCKVSVLESVGTRPRVCWLVLCDTPVSRVVVVVVVQLSVVVVVAALVVMLGLVCDVPPRPRSTGDMGGGLSGDMVPPLMIKRRRDAALGEPGGVLCGVWCGEMGGVWVMTFLTARCCDAVMDGAAAVLRTCGRRRRVACFVPPRRRGDPGGVPVLLPGVVGGV